MAIPPIVIRVTTDTSQFNTGIAKANTKLSGFQQTVGRVTRTLTAFAALFATRQLIGFIGESVKALAKFEQGVANIGILLDEDIGRLGEWRGTIERTAKDLGLATEDLTKAGFDIQSATNNTTRSLEIFRNAARLAVAGGSDVASTVKGALTLNEVYADSFKNVADMMDFLIVAQKKARATIGELSVSSSRFLGVASSLGIKVEELFAVYAQLTRGFGNTKEAATGLSAIMNSLQKPSQAMIDLAQKEYGMSIQRAIATYGLIDVLKKLNTVTAENIGTTLGRMRANRAFGIIRSDINTIEETTIELLEREGKTQEKLAIEMATTQKKLEQISAEFEHLKRSVGGIATETGFLDWLLSVEKSINNMVKGDEIDKIKSLFTLFDRFKGVNPLFNILFGKNIAENIEKATDALSVFQTQQQRAKTMAVIGPYGVGTAGPPELPSAENYAKQIAETEFPVDKFFPTQEDFDINLDLFTQFLEQQVGILGSTQEQMKSIIGEFGNWEKEQTDFQKLQFISEQQEILNATINRVGAEKAAEMGLFNLREQLALAHKNTLIATTQMTLGAMQTGLSALSSALNQAAAEHKEFARAAKAVNLLLAVTNTAAAVTEALKLPFPLNWIQAALVAAAGAIEVGVIAAQGFKEGGLVPGVGRGDKVPAMLEPGELVIPRDSVGRAINNNQRVSVNVSMAGAMVLDDPIAVKKLYREYLRDTIRDDIETGRDKFYV